MKPNDPWEFIVKNPGLYNEEEYQFALSRLEAHHKKWPIRKKIYLHRDDESNYDDFEEYYTAGNFSELDIRCLGLEVEVVVDAFEDGTYQVISVGGFEIGYGNKEIAI